MKLVPTAVTQMVGNQSLDLQKNAPQILFGAGVVGMIGATVLACRATLKTQDVLDRTAADLDATEATRREHPDDYSEMERRRTAVFVLGRSAAEITKLYAPAVVVGGISIACLTKSHFILQDRNMALIAAYNAVDAAFDRYRERVVEKYGEEEDLHFRHGAEEVDVLQEDGTVKQRFRVGDETPSKYARFFDEYSPNWSKVPEYNFVFLSGQQNYANDLLRTRGHVFLNEVYDMLGLSRTEAGAIVGWVLGNHMSDGYIDFGVWDDRDNVREFVNGREASVLLDFNVDGIIYDLIEHKGEALSWQKG